MSYNIGSNFNVSSQLPIDSRTIVEEYSDLNNIQNKYEGLIVFCKENKKYYKYVNNIFEEFENSDINSSELENIKKFIYYGENVTMTPQDYFTWTINDTNQTASLTGYLGNTLSNVIIPYKYVYNDNEYLVTYIDDFAFSGCSSLTSITIPDSVTAMYSGVFQNCINLTSVTISNSVTDICWCAFLSCSNLTSITIPNNVTIIGDYAFQDCINLTSITIPNSVTSIDDGAFDNCSRLSDVYYKGTETQWNNIAISTDNTALINANIHYNVTDSEEINKHNYSNSAHPDIRSKLSNIIRWKDTTTVEQINLLTSQALQSVGDIYKIIDSGTITSNNLSVNTDDCIVYVPTGWTRFGDYITSDNLLSSILAVDGSGSGIDADKLDNQHEYQMAKYGIANGTLVTSGDPTTTSTGGSQMYRFYDTSNLIGEGTNKYYGIMQIYYSASYYVRIAVSMTSGKVYTQTSDSSRWKLLDNGVRRCSANFISGGVLQLNDNIDIYDGDVIFIRVTNITGAQQSLYVSWDSGTITFISNPVVDNERREIVAYELPPECILKFIDTGAGFDVILLNPKTNSNGLKKATCTFVNTSNSETSDSYYVRLMRDNTSQPLTVGDTFMIIKDRGSNYSDGAVVRYIDTTSSSGLVESIPILLPSDDTCPACQLPQHFILYYNGSNFKLLTPPKISSTPTIQILSSDPSNPLNGQMWIRSDL